MKIINSYRKYIISMRKYVLNDYSIRYTNKLLIYLIGIYFASTMSLLDIINQNLIS